MGYTYAADGTRFIVTDDPLGDEMQITLTQSGALNFEIDAPWQGDTESGFGQTCQIYVPVEIVPKLRAWFAQIDNQ